MDQIHLFLYETLTLDQGHKHPTVINTRMDDDPKFTSKPRHNRLLNI